MKRSDLLSAVVLAVSTATSTGCGRTAHGPTIDASPSVSFRVSLTSPQRLLDMVFMIDNSGMASRVTKMTAQFSRLIAALKDQNDGTLPDLRIAIIDSDLGTGGAYSSGSCSPKTLADGTVSRYGDLGRFQMPNASNCGVTSADAQWLEFTKGLPTNFTGDINVVFACLANNLGTQGCGYQHQLQAFEFALVAKGYGNEGQRQMLRPNAQLALFLITEEDDCSAATNDGMFGDKDELGGESASLRCATRAHQCNGINLTTPPPGYPTSASFSAPFSTCAARTDACPSALDGDTATDTSQPTECSPLRSVKRMADGIKSLKANPNDQILVAGIFGWPLSDEDIATATYKIAPVPNPNAADTSHPTAFDLWPICYDPGRKPVNNTDFDSAVAGMGAAPGLRLSAFVDEFGENGLKFSICQSDFTATMSQIGAKLAQQVSSQYNRCLPASFAQYKNCTAQYLVPDPDNSTGYSRQADAVTSCDASPKMPSCYTLVPDAPPCATGEFLVQGDSGSALPRGTLLEFTCQ